MHCTLPFVLAFFRRGMLVGAEEIEKSEPVSKDSHSSSKGKPGNLYRFFGAWEGDEYADMKEKILEGWSGIT